MKFSGIHSGVAVVSLLLLMTTSAVSHGSSPARELTIGDQITEMNLNAEQTLTLRPNEGSGRFTLVNLWASYDAESRARNVELSHFFGQTISDKIVYRAVSLDPSETVYRETIMFDGVDNANQYYASILPKLSAKGMHSYLINDAGVVVSIDPTTAELEQFYRL